MINQSLFPDSNFNQENVEAQKNASLPLEKKEKSLALQNVNNLKKAFPIVGIGASAGGLEALQAFFDEIPFNPGAAFIIIQHLSSDYKSFMNELLKRHSENPIEIAHDNLTIQENHLYLIPPRVNMIIRNGIFYSSEITGQGAILPIDMFFRSLAEDQQSNAIAIILSGTGSDGMLGIRAVKEYGGVTMVQNEQSAKFAGMPRNSISTGVIDIIQTPENLAKELINYIKHPIFSHISPIEDQLLQNPNLYNKILLILKESQNIDFSSYKKNTIIRRLEKRISINRFMKVIDYINYLSETPKEVLALYNDFLIGVTRFFRDRKYFEALSNTTFDSIFKNCMDKGEIRVWVPGCSTGEEAYTLTMMLKDYMIQNCLLNDLKVFATDIDENALAYAGAGFYPNNISTDIPSYFLSKYFIKHNNGYQVTDNIRRCIIFARHNVIDEPPFSKLDLISCRNLLIYVESEAQAKILSTFHTCLKADSILFLGSSESLGKLTEGFDVLNSSAKIFKKRNCFKPDFSPASPMVLPRLRNYIDTPINLSGIRPNNRLLSLVFEDIANTFLPPSVVIDYHYNILYSIHNVSSFLQMPQGQMTTNLLKLLPQEMSVAVSNLIRLTEKSTSRVFTEMKSNGSDLILSCKKIINSNSDIYYYCISFKEKNEPKLNQQSIPIQESFHLSHHYKERIEELEREIQQKNESLQTTVEELGLKNEELQSSNEELIASNEELQGTNEELQSVNEELFTVNAEHLRKIDEMRELTEDYDNLLKNTYIGAIFIGENLLIRKVSKVATSITNILQSDVGRPISHLSFSTLYPEFMDDIIQVNESQKIIEREVSFKKETFIMKIVPYQTKENFTSGMILTFIKVT